MMTKEMIDSAMKDYAKSAKEVYGDKLKEVILYGSCARGDFSEESDVDVMVLLDIKPEEANKERIKMHPAINELDIKYDYEMLFATVVKSYDEFNEWMDVKPFYMNVRREGVRYA